MSDRHIWRAVRKLSGTKDFKVLGTHTGIRVCCGRLKFLPLTPLSTCVSRHCTKGENIFFLLFDRGERGGGERGETFFTFLSRTTTLRFPPDFLIPPASEVSAGEIHHQRRSTAQQQKVEKRTAKKSPRGREMSDCPKKVLFTAVIIRTLMFLPFFRGCFSAREM